MNASDFAHHVRTAIDIMCVLYTVGTVIKATIYSYGHKHVEGSPSKAAMMIANWLCILVWLYWRPTFA